MKLHFNKVVILINYIIKLVSLVNDVANVHKVKNLRDYNYIVRKVDEGKTIKVIVLKRMSKVGHYFYVKLVYEEVSNFNQIIKNHVDFVIHFIVVIMVVSQKMVLVDKLVVMVIFIGINFLVILVPICVKVVLVVNTINYKVV